MLKVNHNKETKINHNNTSKLYSIYNIYNNKGYSLEMAQTINFLKFFLYNCKQGLSHFLYSMLQFNCR